MEKVAHVFASPADAEKAEMEYYRAMTPEQRMEIFCALLAQAQPDHDQAAEGFPRVCRIVKLPSR